MIAISVPMEWDEPVTEAVPLDLTVKKVDDYAVSEVEVEHNGPGKLTEGTLLPPTSPNVAQCATVAVMPPKVQVELPPPPSPQPRCKDYWTPASPSPMMAMEHLAPLHGMYTGTATYQNLVSSSIVIPEYNPFPPVLPTSTDTQFHQQNHIQNLMQHLKMQQQYLLNLQHHLHLQQQLQLQLHNLCKQKLHLQDSGVPLDPVSMLSCSPVHTATSSVSLSESNYFPSPTTDGHYHIHRHHKQRDLHRKHRQHTKACATDGIDVVDPEETAAMYRRLDFLSFHHRYMESFRPPMNIEKIRRFSNNNYNNSISNSSCSNNNNDDNHGLMPGQQQYNQTYFMKQYQKNDKEVKRSRDSKRQKYIEKPIGAMTKKVPDQEGERDEGHQETVDKCQQ